VPGADNVVVVLAKAIESYDVPQHWGSHGLLVQQSVTFGGCLQQHQNNPQHPHNGTQTPPQGGPDLGRAAAGRRPVGLRHLQGYEHHPRHAQALEGPAAPLAPSDAVKMREQEKLIEHMARIVADQAVRMRIMEIALQKKR